MTFASIPFLFYFLPLFIAAYFATPWKNHVMLAGSVLFYAWGEPVYVLLLLASTAFNHAMGRVLTERRSAALLGLGVAANLASLVVFKYAGFITESLAGVVAALGGPAVGTIELPLPLGISFCTFHAISYLVDVHRGDARAPKRLVDTGVYITMFPQLVAGPIVRFKTIEHQLHGRAHTAMRFSAGARLFVLGLSQKVLLANLFAGPADAAFDEDPALLAAGAAWLGLSFYTLQIFFDFAGYSNMALGLGRMFGFRLPRNFNFPYTAQSVTEFWRRWHITLSAWFRDYVYIPLGGNRRGRTRTTINLFAVFLLCGLWHGAAWAFVFWGAWHGAFLVLERSPAGRAIRSAPRMLRHGYLILVVMLSWVPFRTADLGGALGYYGALFGAGRAAPIGAGQIATDDMVYFLALGVLIALWPLVRGSAVALARRLPRALPRSGAEATRSGVRSAGLAASHVAVAGLLLLSAALLAGGAYNPFIYFRF